MGFIEKIFSECLGIFKNSAGTAKTIWGQNRLIRNVACSIILFVYFCAYWNVLDLIDLPCFPLLNSGFREFVLNKINLALILWFFIPQVYSFIEKKIYVKWERKGEKMIQFFFFLEKMTDFVFSVFFLLYAFNFLVDFANGIEVESYIPLYIVITYVFVRFVSGMYYRNLAEYKEARWNYTNYCDANNKRIPYGALVAIEGKLFRVRENNYRPYLMPITYGSGIISLEDAIKKGNVYLLEKQ